MVHYHLTNKNLSWAQVRGFWSTSYPFTGGTGGAALFLEPLCMLLVLCFPAQLIFLFFQSHSVQNPCDL